MTVEVKIICNGWQEFFANPDLILPEEFEVPEDLPLQER